MLCYLNWDIYWIKNTEVIAIFGSHVCITLLVWVQNTNSVKKHILLQKKSVKITFFLSWNSHTGLFYLKAQASVYVCNHTCLLLHITKTFMWYNMFYIMKMSSRIVTYQMFQFKRFSILGIREKSAEGNTFFNFFVYLSQLKALCFSLKLI